MDERFIERMGDKRVAQDCATLAGLTEIYCEDNHSERKRTLYISEGTQIGAYPAKKIPQLCDECAEHLRYGERKRALCRKEPRPSCKECDIHCYAPSEAQWQRESMKYAGKRAMFRGHFMDAVRHQYQTLIAKRGLTKRESAQRESTHGAGESSDETSGRSK
ncbi:MAG: hypothetical protein HGA54_03745 [Actinobacteria bacterium]|nr:hypothetical protein [Actinomycetota bacterium]